MAQGMFHGGKAVNYLYKGSVKLYERPVAPNSIRFQFINNDLTLETLVAGTPDGFGTWTPMDGNGNVFDFTKATTSWAGSSNQSVLKVLKDESNKVLLSFHDFNVLDTNFDGVTDLTHLFRASSSAGFNIHTCKLGHTGDVTTFQNAFTNCTSLTSVDRINSEYAVTFNSMFMGCSALTSLQPFTDSDLLENTSYMFSGCTSLVSAPIIVTGSVTTMRQMFSNCSSLTTVPDYDTDNVQLFGEPTGTHTQTGMFNGCTSLEDLPTLSYNSATSVIGIFNGCSNAKTGLTREYNKMAVVAGITNYYRAFYNCGTNTAEGLAQRQDIPESWGGDMIEEFG